MKRTLGNHWMAPAIDQGRAGRGRPDDWGTGELGQAITGGGFDIHWVKRGPCGHGEGRTILQKSDSEGGVLSGALETLAMMAGWGLGACGGWDFACVTEGDQGSERRGVSQSGAVRDAAGTPAQAAGP